MRAARGLLLLTLLSVSLAACGEPVDLSQALAVDVVSAGWFDAGIINGQNKLVPTVSFKFKNNSGQTLKTLQVNALFRRVIDKDEWGSGFVTVAGSDGLGPGATTDTITIRSQLGYTGTESRLEMFQNTQFVDAKVELFAKYGSVQWVKVGDFPIARRLLQ